MGMMRARWYTANKHAVYASRGVRRPLFVCRRTVVVGGVVVVVLVVGTQCECAARMRWILHTHTQQQQNKCDVSDTPKTNTHSDTHTDLGGGVGFGGVRRTTEIREWCFGVNTVLTRFRVCVCVRVDPSKICKRIRNVAAAECEAALHTLRATVQNKRRVRARMRERERVREQEN